ncbi:putative CheA signal transduction histidine kinase [Halothece sp. PCC 7418]|uniref:hybrid sensor histidine kinase/response regulator n=1 Tax=Halothece sp. (strain PCC 7418) TaxID=65093 RepID=UPI0002A0666B|nr:hybrid sensor histidine kinase/response regulator [Halothece sp. PCC 7418]AFZ43393.1 putative CheA signal transduction histidine kinase [Halothece sp. PCC 7418]
MQPTQSQTPDRNQYLQNAKTNLETIERGLLNLSGVVRQPETLQRLHSAAESLNTGALIHEMETIQQIAQFFEDCFGVMRTASVVSDKHLENLLWQVFDTFQGLVEMHAMSEEPTEYTEGVEREVFKGLQPKLTEAKNYLQSRILHEEATVSELTPESDFFQQQVDAELKAMERIIEQENPSHYRTELKEHCQVLEQIGAQAQLPTWVKLLKTAQSAIAATENSVKTATECAIAEIREAQRLINKGQAYTIKPSQRLKAMSLQLSSPWDTQNYEDDDETYFDDFNEEDFSGAQASPMSSEGEELDEKATIADLDGIPETSDSEEYDFLQSLDLETDLWEEDSIDLDLPATIDHSDEHLELWDEQQTITEESTEWWNEQETALEDDGAEENLEQWLTEQSQPTDDDETFFEELFAEDQGNEDELWEEEIELEQETPAEDSEALNTDALWGSLNLEGLEADQETLIEEDNNPDQEWDELFEALEAEKQDAQSEKEAEEQEALSQLDALDDDDSEDHFSWSEQTFEPLEDLESIFANEGEKTFIQDQAEDSAFSEEEEDTFDQTYIQASPLEELRSAWDYYLGIEQLDSVIEAPAIAQSEEDFDLTALETSIEQAPALPQPEETQKETTPAQAAAPASRGGVSLFEQTIKVPVRLMDNLNNLIGELVVNRNSLEKDQERLRQFLDNLLEQVQNLNDLGVRMQDLYERSLLENSLLMSKSYSTNKMATAGNNHGDGSSSNSNSYDEEYNPLEMDRFSGFHLLSQEMIELIVRVRESTSDIEFLVDEVEQEARLFRQVTTQLQEGFTEARMVPFSQVADRLPRAVRDISLKLNKKAKLEVEGKDTLVDKMILEQLYDPMTHLVNNAITHGIESPEERQHFGKPETGTIKVEAHHQGNQSIISISDDGAGLDPVRIRRKAVEKGLISKAEASALPDIDIFDFIFHPGFSTKDKADDFAGRGVGMDVVRSSLSKLRGSINIDSSLGKGTTFTIGLPLTLSITTALCCKLNQSDLAFPMDGVEDKFETTKDNIKINQNGERFIRWQKSSTLLPFKPLSELLSYNRTLTRSNLFAAQAESDEMSIVVLRSTGNLVAVQVDQVLGQQEIVIKQLAGPIPKPLGIAGVTVTSDGSVMAIADVLELIDLFYGRVRKDVMNSMLAQQEQAAEQQAGDAEPMVLIVDDSITVRELLSMTFSKAGYRVEQARDGKDAWEKLRAGLACDMMFCDIEMPRMDGLELLSRVKEEERFADLPVGMLTSRGAERHRQMATRLGAKGYFTKPYLEEVLLDAAKRMLEGENLMDRKATSAASQS